MNKVSRPELPNAVQSKSISSRPKTAASSAQLIIFATGAEQHGVDITAAPEIKGWSEIGALPAQPDYVRGVVNLRGSIVPIVGLRCRFGNGLTMASPLHVILIVLIGNQPIGLLADRVFDIVSVDEREIKRVPRDAHSERLKFLSGLVADTTALVDLAHLLLEAVEGTDASATYAAAA